MNPQPPIYGLLAEFEHPEELIEAVRRTRKEGYAKIGANTPFPVEGLAEELGHHDNILPAIVLTGGLAGCIGGFFLQYWIHVVDYPLNIGGRPLNSWPAFIPVTFETTILAAALSAVLGMLALNGLPTPHHPLFNVEQFEHASRDRFFLSIQARDPRFDRQSTRKFLEGLKAKSISEVEF